MDKFIEVQTAYNYLLNNKDVYDSLLNMQIEGFCDLEDKIREPEDSEVVESTDGFSKEIKFECE